MQCGAKRSSQAFSHLPLIAHDVCSIEGLAYTPQLCPVICLLHTAAINRTNAHCVHGECFLKVGSDRKAIHLPCCAPSEQPLRVVTIRGVSRSFCQALYRTGGHLSCLHPHCVSLTCAGRGSAGNRLSNSQSGCSWSFVAQPVKAPTTSGQSEGRPWTVQETTYMSTSLPDTPLAVHQPSSMRTPAEYQRVRNDSTSWGQHQMWADSHGRRRAPSSLNSFTQRVSIEQRAWHLPVGIGLPKTSALWQSGTTIAFGEMHTSLSIPCSMRLYSGLANSKSWHRIKSANSKSGRLVKHAHVRKPHTRRALNAVFLEALASARHLPCTTSNASFRCV
jgi:hypothetical protein